MTKYEKSSMSLYLITIFVSITGILVTWFNMETTRYNVKDLPGLLSALKLSHNGDTIYIEPSSIICVDSVKGIKIDKSTVLISNGTATLYTDSTYPEKDYASVIQVNASGVVIRGLRIKGPTDDITDHAQKWINGIYVRGNHVLIDSCEISGFNRMGVWFWMQKRNALINSYIYNCGGLGYGYGTWLGGAGYNLQDPNTVGDTCLIASNLFERCRAAIDASGSPHSFIFMNNCIMRRQIYYNVKRHGSGGGYYGGVHTLVYNNVFLSTQQHFELPYPLGDTGICEITGNYFQRLEDDTLAPVGKIGAVFYKNVNKPNIHIHNNRFGGNGLDSILPVAIMSWGKDSTEAGTYISWGCVTSYAQLGHQIKTAIWRFGYGNTYGNEERALKYMMYYKYPGIYVTMLNVVQEDHRASKTVMKTVKVYNTDSSSYLTWNWKDSYDGRLTGFYNKQCIIDDSIIVYQDDVAGIEGGWQRPIVNINRFKDGKQHKLSFKMVCNRPITDPANQISEIYVWLDDVAFTSRRGVNGYTFEGSAKLPLGWYQRIISPNPAYSVSTAVTTEDARSGEQSLRFRIPFNSKTVSGLSAEFYTFFKL